MFASNIANSKAGINFSSSEYMVRLNSGLHDLSVLIAGRKFCSSSVIYE